MASAGEIKRFLVDEVPLFKSEGEFCKKLKITDDSAAKYAIADVENELGLIGLAGDDLSPDCRWVREFDIEYTVARGGKVKCPKVGALAAAPDQDKPAVSSGWGLDCIGQ